MTLTVQWMLLKETPLPARDRYLAESESLKTLCIGYGGPITCMPFTSKKCTNWNRKTMSRRCNFRIFFLDTCQENPNFGSLMLSSDEATFSDDGILNTRNNHTWSVENPLAYYEKHSQDKLSVNVWVGVISDYLIGPYIMPDRLNAHAYLVFLKHGPPELMEDVPILVRGNMWFHHDGAPAHYGLGVHAYLHRTYPGRWMGRGRNVPVRWPARCPDFNVIDFLCGVLRKIMFRQPM